MEQIYQADVLESSRVVSNQEATLPGSLERRGRGWLGVGGQIKAGYAPICNIAPHISLNITINAPIEIVLNVGLNIAINAPINIALNVGINIAINAPINIVLHIGLNIPIHIGLKQNFLRNQCSSKEISVFLKSSVIFLMKS